MGLITILYPDMFFFFFFHCSSLSSCYHSHYHSTGTISTAYTRGMTATPSRGTQTTMPLLPLSLSPHTHCCHCLHLQACKLCFFSSFFHFISDQCCRDLFSPHAGFSNPHLSTMRHLSNLASPTTTITGMQVKICFFCFFFFIPFLTNVTETLFTPHTGSSTPASPPHNPYPHILPLKPHKSPPPPLPHHMQVMTSASPLRHVQVHCHHPVTVHKTHCDTALTPSQHGMQAQL